MSREIRFRGKRKDNGEWVYGGYCKDDFHVEDVKHYIIDQNNEAFGYVKIVQVSTETVGQYTGLKDRNGKEIYEGDIILSLHKGYNDLLTEEPFVVKWIDEDEQGYGIGWGLFPTAIDYEVIGNIYENNDLLEAN